MNKFCSDWHTFHDDIVEVFSKDEACFLSRIGGSDTTALIDYLRAKEEGDKALERHLQVHLPICERYNGFYDLDGNKVQRYFEYLDLLHRCYLDARLATFCHSHFLSTYFPDQIHESFVTKDVPNKQTLMAFVDGVVGRPEFSRAYPYNFIEGVVKNPFTLFQTFTKILDGKTVLVASPFSESVAANFANRRFFFKGDYRYPDFELALLTTPITYAGLAENLYPNRNWFQTVSSLQAQMASQEFDIALLSCGSYAMTLGEFASSTLGKKAIYVGGVLQLYFGIMGRRYDNPYFIEQLNVERFRAPLERERFIDLLPTSDSAAREAFGAYF